VWADTATNTQAAQSPARWQQFRHTMKFYASILLLCVLFSCHPKKQSVMANSSKESLSERAKRLSIKYNLTQTGFDCECIYVKGDLTDVITSILTHLLPNEKFEIAESISKDGDKFIAIVKHNSGQEFEFYADTHDDFLPEGFSYLLESIPSKIGSDKRFYMINPLLLGQDVWYFCGTEANLTAAKNEGLPIIYSGEDFMSMDISEFE